MTTLVDACESIASGAGLRLTWTCIAGSKISELHPEQTTTQFEAAIRTTLIHATSLPLRIVFLLNTSGEARSAESLVYGTFRQRITKDNYLASCEVSDNAISRCQNTDNVIVVWIDDFRVPDPHSNPYTSRLKRLLYNRYPVILDAMRQRRTARVDRVMLARMERLRAADDKAFYPTSPRAEGQTILFSLYWLDIGGAEAFAIQSMVAARAAGYRVVVTCDESGRHRLLARASHVADAVYLIGSYGSGITKEAALLRVIREHRPALIHIHHSWTMYRLLPTVRTLALTSAVIDTTHILEHRFAGFVGEAALYSEYIDCHHVISHDLADLMTNRLHVATERIQLGKLHDLSKAISVDTGKWAQREPITIAFVGRYQQQKRPYLFIEIAKRLVRRFGRERLRFVSVGEGRLRTASERLAEHNGLADVIAFRPGTSTVVDTLAEAHILLIPSDNEGLTLVAFEAMRAGCVVISSDVGAQREIVLPELLVRSAPYACVREMTDRVGQILDGRLDPLNLLDKQQVKLTENLAEPTGTEVCLAFYRKTFERECNDVSAT